MALGSKEMVRLTKELDPNKDGKIVYSEFNTAFKLAEKLIRR